MQTGVVRSIKFLPVNIICCIHLFPKNFYKYLSHSRFFIIQRVKGTAEMCDSQYSLFYTNRQFYFLKVISLGRHLVGKGSELFFFCATNFKQLWQKYTGKNPNSITKYQAQEALTQKYILHKKCYLCQNTQYGKMKLV